MGHHSILLVGLLACFVDSSVGRVGIINGGLAAVNQYKYHVAVNIPGRGYICSGALIGNQHVLTAAHCVIEFDGLFVDRAFIIAGTNDIQQTGPPAQRAEVTKIYVSREYIPTLLSSTGDIAVLKLKNPLHMDHPQRSLEHVHLPENDHDDYFDKNGTITGFGWDWVAVNGNAVTGGHIQTQLRHALATVLSKSQCERDHHLQRISERHLCARIGQTTNGTHGVCNHDGGGPLVFERTVIGVLSQYPIDCSERRTSGIYTRVSSYLDFIHNAVHDKWNYQMRAHYYHY